jgi:adenine-specific DNA-methyltransferase
MADKYVQYSQEELVRLLRERDRKPKFGLVWERDEIDHDNTLNDDFVVLDVDPALSCGEVPWKTGQ